jgi:lysozyme
MMKIILPLLLLSAVSVHSIDPVKTWFYNGARIEGFHPSSIPLLNLVPISMVQKQVQPPAPSNELPVEFVNKVKFFEGFNPKAYYCCGGVKTIGYGATDKKIVKMGTISESAASKFLLKELEECRNKVRSIVKVPLTQNQELALTSFTMNLGDGALKSLVNGKNRLNSGNYKNVPDLIKLYRKEGGKTRTGLVKRRSWEIEMFQNNI